jgi:hypothetical protein
MHIRSLLLCLAVASACGGADTPSDTTPPPAEEAAAPAAEETAPAATEPPTTDPAAAPATTDPAATGGITVAVQNLVKGQSGASKKLAVKATSSTNQITVHLEGLTHYCSPEPSFTAAVEGEKLVLTVAKPAGAVSRCFAPHDLDAVVSLPGRNNVRTVSVLGDGGKEVGSATVTAGK